MLGAFGVRGTSNIIGTVEIATGLAIASRPFAPDPVYAGPRDVPPSEVEPGCLEARVGAMAVSWIRRPAVSPISFKLAVGRGGRISQLEVTSVSFGAARDVEAARRAVLSGPLRPGADASGRPRAFWFAWAVKVPPAK